MILKYRRGFWDRLVKSDFIDEETEAQRKEMVGLKLQREMQTASLSATLFSFTLYFLQLYLPSYGHQTSQKEFFEK